MVLAVLEKKENAAKVVREGNVYYMPGCEVVSAAPRYTGEHTSTPIKNKADVQRVSEYFGALGMDMMQLLFTVGVNTAYRISDILSLRWEEVLEDDGTVTEKNLNRVEQKTRNRNKKRRKVFLNATVREALAQFRGTHETGVYVFESPRNPGVPVTRQYVDKWLKKAVADLDIDVRAGTHMMRKTFAYHHIVEAKDRARALEQLMLLLGHTSLDVTLDYAGITEDELKDCYEEVQLAAII